MTVTIGLLGAGRIGLTHAEALATIPEAQVAAMAAAPSGECLGDHVGPEAIVACGHRGVGGEHQLVAGLGDGLRQ